MIDFRVVFNIVYGIDVTNTSGVTCVTGVKSDIFFKRNRKVLMFTRVTLSHWKTTLDARKDNLQW